MLWILFGLLLIPLLLIWLKNEIIHLVKTHPPLLITFSSVRKSVRDTATLLLWLKDSQQILGLEFIYNVVFISIVFCDNILFFQELALAYRLECTASIKNTLSPITSTALAQAEILLEWFQQLNQYVRTAYTYWSAYYYQQVRECPMLAWIEDFYYFAIGGSIVPRKRLPTCLPNLMARPGLDIAEETMEDRISSKTTRCDLFSLPDIKSFYCQYEAPQSFF